MTAKTDRRPAARLLPADLATVALIDALTCAVAGDMSLSWWYEEVRARRAPQPVIRAPRCTRWRLADVAAFWAALAARSEADIETGARMTARAKKASIKAHEPSALAKSKATRRARIAAREGTLA